MEQPKLSSTLCGKNHGHLWSPPPQRLMHGRASLRDLLHPRGLWGGEQQPQDSCWTWQAAPQTTPGLVSIKHTLTVPCVLWNGKIWGPKKKQRVNGSFHTRNTGSGHPSGTPVSRTVSGWFFLFYSNRSPPITPSKSGCTEHNYTVLRAQSHSDKCTVSSLPPLPRGKAYLLTPDPFFLSRNGSGLGTGYAQILACQFMPPQASDFPLLWPSIGGIDGRVIQGDL